MHTKIEKGVSDPSVHKRTLDQTTKDGDDDDFVVPASRPKRTRSSAIVLSNKTSIFKLKKGKNFWWVPRELYLRDRISNFILGLNDRDFSIEPYRGARESEDAKRQTMYTQIVNGFKVVAKECVPDMKNGHVMDGNIIHRALVTQLKNNNLMTGVIYFTINLDMRTCQIKGIEVQENYRKNKLGYYLLHTAILVALFYGCEHIEAFSDQNGKGFLEKNGFVNQLDVQSSNSKGDSADCILNLLDPSSRLKLLQCVKSWTSERYIKSLISMLANNAKTLTPEYKLPENLRPNQSEFPLTAFLASYLFRNNKKEIDAKEVEAIKAQRTAQIATHSTALVRDRTPTTTTPIVSSIPTPPSQNMFFEAKTSVTVTNGDIDDWWECFNL